jgi:hypothetical protein
VSSKSSCDAYVATANNQKPHAGLFFRKVYGAVSTEWTSNATSTELKYRLRIQNATLTSPINAGTSINGPMTPTKASPEFRESVDHDGPCGDPGQLFSYVPKEVLRWLDRF